MTLCDFFIDVLLLGLFVRALAFVFRAGFTATIVILDDEGRTEAGVISVTVITVPVVGSRVMGRVHTKGGLGEDTDRVTTNAIQIRFPLFHFFQ